ncbi:MAG TPA: thioredoxin [Candidatus Kapabacteria bacterium]|nr:thioredoxin [Candidatus Kapabacteria bacterium]
MSIIVKCTACGTKNRIKENSNQTPICGKCKKPIIIQKIVYPVHLIDADFDTFIRNSPKPVLVDFWAQWCGPCRLLAPVLETFANSQSSIIIAKLDTDKNPLTSSRFQILSIPTIILFDEGKEVKRMTGALNLQQLETLLKPWITIN